ncbi:MAG: hypothetical protein V9E94_14940 [Microthrixaceae bacterium]
MADPDVVIVDADTVAGWRRVTPSYTQLADAVRDLRGQAPSATVAIVGDPALKWALSSGDQVLLDDEINHQRLVLAPAGSRGGHTGFIAEAVRKGSRRGVSVVVVTDRAIPECPIARLRREGERFVFDLAGAATTTVPTTAPRHRRRRATS